MNEDASSIASVDQPRVMRFRAITDADPRAIVAILQHLQTLNVVPKAVIAHRLGDKYVEIKVETDNLSIEAFRRMVAKIGEMPIVIAAVPFDVDWTDTTTCA